MMKEKELLDYDNPRLTLCELCLQEVCNLCLGVGFLAVLKDNGRVRRHISCRKCNGYHHDCHTRDGEAI